MPPKPATQSHSESPDPKMGPPPSSFTRHKRMASNTPLSGQPEAIRPTQPQASTPHLLEESAHAPPMLAPIPSSSSTNSLSQEIAVTGVWCYAPATWSCLLSGWKFGFNDDS